MKLCRFVTTNSLIYDVAIIGGGIIGVAIGRQITQRSKDVKCILIEKENVLGNHQTSHNSGVVHSVRVQMLERRSTCQVPLHAMLHEAYRWLTELRVDNSSRKRRKTWATSLSLFTCRRENNVACKTYGKLIVARDYTETDTLRCLYERAEKNNVGDVKMLWTKQQIKQIEPKCNGIQALWSHPLNHPPDCDYPITVKSKANNEIRAKYLIICGGLYSEVLDSIVKQKDEKKTLFISLRTGYQLLEEQTISTNLYGVPDIEIPFLGIHISPTVDGGVLLGPAAVPAYRIEGYRNDELNLSYLRNTFNSPCFQNMAKRYFITCLNQVRSTFCPNFQVSSTSTS
ncbi:hypothetical protein NQ318_007370 [Aromia moschata]|uniref:L-2-hydroxyglutarate dehydrogenase, mitochondrial n=1 Tax=Aromia moschata TaxID=1265417 RepID=A0AAV8YD51_9CUCU|nr:hypothetical protein NQ318_007370 [Aromia moschata]